MPAMLNSHICRLSFRMSHLSMYLQVQLKREGQEGSAHLVDLQGQHQELQKQLQQAQKVKHLSHDASSICASFAVPHVCIPICMMTICTYQLDQHTSGSRTRPVLVAAGCYLRAAHPPSCLPCPALLLSALPCWLPHLPSCLPVLPCPALPCPAAFCPTLLAASSALLPARPALPCPALPCCFLPYSAGCLTCLPACPSYPTLLSLLCPAAFCPTLLAAFLLAHPALPYCFLP